MKGYIQKHLHAAANACGLAFCFLRYFSLFYGSLSLNTHKKHFSLIHPKVKLVSKIHTQERVQISH